MAECEVVSMPADELNELLKRVEKRWLAVEDAAKYSSLSVESIRRMLSSGRLTAHRPVRGRVIVDRSELDAVIRSSTGPSHRGRGRRGGMRSDAKRDNE